MPNRKLPDLFENFQQFIYETPKETSTPPGSDTVRKETNQIIREIDHELLAVHTRKQASFYIHKIELSLSNFQAVINKELKQCQSRAENLRACLENIERIRYHLETTYSIYRDPTQPLSATTVNTWAAKLDPDIKQIKLLLLKQDIELALVKAITRPIERHFEGPFELTGQKLDYLIYFLGELKEFLESKEAIEDTHLLQFLYVLNFNNIAILCYICERHKRITEEMEDSNQVLEYLAERMTMTDHIPVIQRKPYNPNLVDLKTQVHHWIEEEISLVKKSLSKSNHEHPADKPAKLRFNQSVEVIATLFRLLQEANITTSGANQTIRWIAKNVSSKNQRNISLQSVQRKFFDKHTNKEPLKDIIIQLLNHINHT